MKDKKVTIKVRRISTKQWSVFLLELNSMKKEWKPYGVDMELITPQLKRVLAWGARRHDETSELDNKKK